MCNVDKKAAMNGLLIYIVFVFLKELYASNSSFEGKNIYY